MINSTLCYIERDDEYLVIHRTKKENDLNHDKWIGVGGKFEDKESPEECLLREAKEETGLTLISYKYRGIVTFVSDKWETEYMHLFTADMWTGELSECDEGELEWKKKSFVEERSGWEGDRYFLSLLRTDEPFFSMKLEYKAEKLVSVYLNGSAVFSLNRPLEKLAVSACLLGACCKYNGGSNRNDRIIGLKEKYDIIPVCPETAGGLKRPRDPAEIIGDRVIDKSGRDVTAEFNNGARSVLNTLIAKGCKKALLKQNSPSCGSKMIYDGCFSGNKIPGMGIAARLLADNGITVYGEDDDIDKLL